MTQHDREICAKCRSEIRIVCLTSNPPQYQAECKCAKSACFPTADAAIQNFRDNHPADNGAAEIARLKQEVVAMRRKVDEHDRARMQALRTVAKAGVRAEQQAYHLRKMQVRIEQLKRHNQKLREELRVRVQASKMSDQEMQIHCASDD